MDCVTKIFLKATTPLHNAMAVGNFKNILYISLQDEAACDNLV